MALDITTAPDGSFTIRRTASDLVRWERAKAAAFAVHDASLRKLATVDGPPDPTPAESLDAISEQIRALGVVTHAERHAVAHALMCAFEALDALRVEG